MFLQVSVCPRGGGRAWLLPGGACMVAPGGGCYQGGMLGCLGGMRVCSGGHAWLLLGGVWGVCACSQGGHAWLLPGGHVWLLQGGMHGCSRGHMWLLRGAFMIAPGGHAWDTMRYGDMVNEQAVRILLECILVHSWTSTKCDTSQAGTYLPLP